MSVSSITNANLKPEGHWIEEILDPTLLRDDSGIIYDSNRVAFAFFVSVNTQLLGRPALRVISTESRRKYTKLWNPRTLVVSFSEWLRTPLSVLAARGNHAPVWLGIGEVIDFDQPMFTPVFKDAPDVEVRNNTTVIPVRNYLSPVRHQLRNRLLGIRTFTDFLLCNKPGNLGDKQICYHEAIRDTTVQLSTVIEEIDVPEMATVDYDIQRLHCK